MSLRICLLAILVGSSACGLFDSPAVDRTWPQVLECGAEVADDLLTKISTELLHGTPDQLHIGDRARLILENLKEQHGASVVACLVDLLRREWRRPGLSSSPERAAAAARADDFLQKVGTEVKSNAAYSED